jgi:hypothetical protein
MDGIWTGEREYGCRVAGEREGISVWCTVVRTDDEIGRGAVIPISDHKKPQISNVSLRN